VGFEFLVDHFARFRKVWEANLWFIVRGQVMEFELEVSK